jgi:quercetin dioxygenase-like cupin family protein
MSVIHRFCGNNAWFSWDGVNGIEMNEEGLNKITRHILIGNQEGAPNYIMRYFRLEPGGHSRLERHPQEHQVLILHGRGQTTIGVDEYEVNPFDAIFIEGNELHQFRNSSIDPFGFICIIPK